MKAKTMTWLLCAALTIACSTPAVAGHRHGGHYYEHYRPHHSHHHRWGNDFGCFVGMSALAILPQVLYAQQMQSESVSVPYQYDEAPSVSMTPTNQAIVVSNIDYGDDVAQYQTAVANEVMSRVNADDSAARRQYVEAVRSLPANARVIQTANGTEYEWLGQRYHYDWQSDLYQPVSQ